MTDSDIRKEAEPSEFINLALPVLRKNGLVHFLGFGNRLGFDSVPAHLQVNNSFMLRLYFTERKNLDEAPPGSSHTS